MRNMSHGFSSLWVTSTAIPQSHVPLNIVGSSSGPCRKAVYVYVADSENLTATSSDVAPQRENSSGRVKCHGTAVLCKIVGRNCGILHFWQPTCKNISFSFSWRVRVLRECYWHDLDRYYTENHRCAVRWFAERDVAIGLSTMF